MKWIIAWTFTCTSLYAATPIFGYGSSDAVIPAKDQELFYTGFEAGFEKVFRAKMPKDLVILENVYTGSQLGATESALKLISKGVQAIAGFPTSHEAVLAGRIAKEKNIFALFPGSSHSDLATFGPYVYSTGESMEAGIVRSLNFIQKSFAQKPGILVVNPYAVYSEDQRRVFDRLLKTPKYASVSLDTCTMNSDSTLELDKCPRLSRAAYLYFTQYASETNPVMKQLQALSIDIPILTSSSWLTGDIEFVRRYLTPRKSPLYSVAVWLKGEKSSLEFETDIRKRYGIEATPEIAYGYDVGAILAKTYMRAKKNSPVVTSQALREAFVAERCFYGLSSGRICFGPKGGHAIREVKLVLFTKNGFKQVD